MAAGLLMLVGLLALVGGWYYVRQHTGVIGDISEMASDMCDCSSADCAADVQARYQAWYSEHRSTLVTVMENQDVREQNQRYSSCLRTWGPRGSSDQIAEARTLVQSLPDVPEGTADDYAQKVNVLADEMCLCADHSCRLGVKSRLKRLSRWDASEYATKVAKEAERRVAICFDGLE